MIGMVLNESQLMGNNAVKKDEKIVLFLIYKNCETSLRNLHCHTKCHARFFYVVWHCGQLSLKISGSESLSFPRKREISVNMSHEIFISRDTKI